MSKLEKVMALKNGDGVASLLTAACEIFHNPIALFDSYYCLKEYAEIINDDPLWNELISTGVFSMKTQEFFANECFTEDVANADKLVILKSSQLKYDRILGRIYNKNGVSVANIVMVLCETPLQDGDLPAFDILAEKITFEISDDVYYTEFGKTFLEKYINGLLDQVVTDPKVYTAQIQILYNGFEDYLFVAVVDVSHNGDQQNKLVYFKNLLEGMYPSFKFAIYHDPKIGSGDENCYIVMIMSFNYNVFDEKMLFSGMENLFRQNNLFIGVSDSFENLYELRKYYDQAVLALTDGINKNGDQWVFLYKTDN